MGSVFGSRYRLETEPDVKILLLTASPIRFTVATPGTTPLGGTESSVAYLARALAARGHAVSLVAQLPPDFPKPARRRW